MNEIVFSAFRCEIFIANFAYVEIRPCNNEFQGINLLSDGMEFTIKPDIKP